MTPNDMFDDFLNSWFRRRPDDGDALTDWMAAGQPESASKAGDRSVARYGWRVRAVAAAACVGAAVAAAVAVVGPNRGLAVPLVGIAAFGGWASAGTTYTRVEWDREYVYARSPWRGSRTLPWDALAAVDYSTLLGYTLDFGPGGTVRVGDLIAGSAVVVRFARARVRLNRRRAASR